VVRTLVGSIGLIASVPLTTALAALVASRDGRKPLPPQRGGGPAAEPVAAGSRHRHRR